MRVRGEKWVHDGPRGLCVALTRRTGFRARTTRMYYLSSHVCDSVVLALSLEHVLTCLLLFDTLHKSIRLLPGLPKSPKIRHPPTHTPHYVQLAR